MAGSTARFRVHGELSELVLARRRLERAVDGTSTVKHLIEELGIPHTEYGEVRVNGVPSHGGHRVQDGDVVDVYPAEPATPPVSEPRFVLDVHLGTLARYLRLLGFDTAYDNHSGDDDLLARAAAEDRTLLTRDRGILRRRAITDARLVRGTAGTARRPGPAPAAGRVDPPMHPLHHVQRHAAAGAPIRRGAAGPTGHAA
jgi:uncharacterized protein